MALHIWQLSLLASADPYFHVCLKNQVDDEHAGRSVTFGSPLRFVATHARFTCELWGINPSKMHRFNMNVTCTHVIKSLQYSRVVEPSPRSTCELCVVTIATHPQRCLRVTELLDRKSVV